MCFFMPRFKHLIKYLFFKKMLDKYLELLYNAFTKKGGKYKYKKMD